MASYVDKLKSKVAHALVVPTPSEVDKEKWNFLWTDEVNLEVVAAFTNVGRYDKFYHMEPGRALPLLVTPLVMYKYPSPFD